MALNCFGTWGRQSVRFVVICFKTDLRLGLKEDDILFRRWELITLWTTTVYKFKSINHNI